MARHIIHFAVTPFREPGRQTGFGVAKIHVGNGDGIEAQLRCPDIQLLRQSAQRRQAVRFNRDVQMIQIFHPADDTGRGISAHLDGEADTAAMGAALAPALLGGLVIYLRGDLGAGKTTLVRGALRALGHAGKVKSPTYTLIEPYVFSRLNLYHLDFYRFAVPE